MGAMAQSSAMFKYGFRIRTRSGTPVENLVVHARDQAEAERKLNQVYPHCEITECRVIHTTIGDDGPNLESIISLISKQTDESAGG
jgi:hypothetical protein